VPTWVAATTRTALLTAARLAAVRTSRGGGAAMRGPSP
jgi:hypothetical protein